MSKTKDQLVKYVLDRLTIVYIIQTRPYTAIEVRFDYYGYEFFEKAASKVKWPDNWDSDFGLELCMKKAAAKIVKKIYRDEELLKDILGNLNWIDEMIQEELSKDFVETK